MLSPDPPACLPTPQVWIRIAGVLNGCPRDSEKEFTTGLVRSMMSHCLMVDLKGQAEKVENSFIPVLG